ncbi:MAG: hypothetical protein ACD_45C00273G0002 [uncultured bacterium]|nr:MAG: hypothetical protein ACD_45C00273G0002 [uncultured bacterium]OGT54076.1 MAG: dTMP kinase [Gammaproteobacteria bacterium RIFCSPHIGHO2_12_FULL_42_10]
MMPGKLITLEGIEGAGKSTARQFVTEYLTEKGIEVVSTREPGGTAISEAIRNVLLSHIENEVMTAETELLLMFASRAQHVRYRIVPWLEAGKWVISDRYIDASYAYQGGGRGMDLHLIHLLDQAVVGSVYPALTFLLDIAPAMGMARASSRGLGKDRIEQEKLSFFERVRSAYLLRAAADPARWAVIDASKTVNQVQYDIQCHLDRFLVQD